MLTLNVRVRKQFTMVTKHNIASNISGVWKCGLGHSKLGLDQVKTGKNDTVTNLKKHYRIHHSDTDIGHECYKEFKIKTKTQAALLSPPTSVDSGDTSLTTDTLQDENEVSTNAPSMLLSASKNSSALTSSRIKKRTTEVGAATLKRMSQGDRCKLVARAVTRIVAAGSVSFNTLSSEGFQGL